MNASRHGHGKHFGDVRGFLLPHEEDAAFLEVLLGNAAAPPGYLIEPVAIFSKKSGRYFLPTPNLFKGPGLHFLGRDVEAR